MELIPRSSDIDDFVNAVARDIGELPKLITSEKGNLVDAINEIALRHVDIVKGTEYNIKIAEIEARLDTIKDSNSGLPLKVWTGTQEEYDLVTDKDPETLYILKNTGVSP